MTVKNVTEKLLENWPAKIVCLALALLLFMFYRMSTLEQRVFSVPLRIQTNGDIVPAASYPRTVTVRLRGEMDTLYPVEEKDISVFVDLSSLEREGEFRFPLQVRIAGAAGTEDALETAVEPSEIRIRVESRTVKKVPVVPNFSGYPEAGYEFDGYLINPVSVEVSGPRTVVESIEEMQTEAIDLSGRNAGFEGTALLVNRNSLITVSSGGTVEYRVRIAPTIVTRTLTGITIKFDSLDDRFHIQSDTGPGVVTVRGRQIDLANDTVLLDSLRVNARNISSSGIYSLPVTAVLPEGMEILDYSPREIQITVARKDE